LSVCQGGLVLSSGVSIFVPQVWVINETTCRLGLKAATCRRTPKAAGGKADKTADPRTARTE
jgi:hypothetical protein